MSVVEEGAYVEADDQAQDETIELSDKMVPVSDALVVKRDTIKLDHPQGAIPRPTPIVDLMPTPPHLKSRTTGPQFDTPPGQRNPSLWDKAWDVFDINETPYPKPGSFEKRSHPTPIKNEHPGKRRNTNPDDAFTSRPAFDFGTSTVSKKEEDPISLAPAKEPSDPVLNSILSRLSGSLEKMSISIDNQSKSLEQLTTRVDAIEERRSQRSSRSQSRASGRGEIRQPYDVPAKALESALLNSREQRERKAGFQSIFDDDPAYVPPRTASHTLNRKTPGAEKATPILRPTRFMPSIAGCYANPNDIGKFWAEICTPNNPLYEHDTKHPPKVPQGYSGEWVITDENPPRWAFVGEDLEDVERRKKMEELESKAKMQREAERLEKTRKERTDELRNDEEGNRMFAYHRNDRPSSRRMKEDSDSDNEFFKNKNKLPVQPYRSNTTYQPTVSQSPSFNRRSSTNQARSHPPPSKDRNDRALYHPLPSKDRNDRTPYPSKDRNDRTPYRPPDPYLSDSDDEQRKGRRPSRKALNIQSDDSSDDYIINTRIQKIDASVIGVLDPDKGATNQYCENLRRLVALFGEKSVVAAIPSSFTGRAKDWFASHSMDPKKMRRVEGWIEELKAEFKVNTAAARAEAKDRKYTLSDSDVMKYYYAKSGLLRTANEEISRQDLIGEVWLGLPADFRMSLRFSEVEPLSLQEFSHVLRDIDVTYREKKREERREKERNRDKNYEHERVRSSTRDRDHDRKSDRKRSKRSPVESDSDSLKDKGKMSSKDDSIPEILPESQWRINANGKKMKRRCRYCDEWHFDYQCPQSQTPNYSVQAVDQEAPGPVSDHRSSSSYTSEDKSTTTTHSFHAIAATADVFPNGIRRIEHAEIKLAGVDKFTIDEIPPAPHIGTGVSYLTTEPCPIKAWVGEAPSSDAPLKPGVADSGSPASVIGRNMLTDNAELLQSPTNPIFQGLGKGRTPTEGYVVMPVYLPSAAAMAGDTRKARIAKIMVEFQVVEYCPAGFLLGRDAMKAYKMVIDEEKSAIWVNSIVPPIKVPITEGTRYDSHRIDSRIFIAETTCIKPGERLFVPVRYQVPDESTLYMFASPARINSVTGIYASCLHSLMRRDTTHLCIVNAGHRPAKIVKDTVIATYALVTTNTAYAYLNVTDRSASNSRGVAGPFNLSELAISNPLNAIDKVNGSNVWMNDVTSAESLLEASSAKCKSDPRGFKIKLSCHSTSVSDSVSSPGSSDKVPPDKPGRSVMKLPMAKARAIPTRSSLVGHLGSRSALDHVYSFGYCAGARGFHLALRIV